MVKKIQSIPISKYESPSAFEGDETLSRVNIPDGVTHIGDKAFKDCTNLSRIVIPDSVTSIGKNAFYNCI